MALAVTPPWLRAYRAPLGLALHDAVVGGELRPRVGSSVLGEPHFVLLVVVVEGDELRPRAGCSVVARVGGSVVALRPLAL